MTDRELLELAAKAAGLRGEYCEFTKHPEGFVKAGIGDPRRFGWGDPLWNPLIDDGDALRLAVKFGIDPDGCGLEIAISSGRVIAGIDCQDGPNVVEWGGDPYAATRRAIVRAAAEIGRTV